MLTPTAEEYAAAVAAVKALRAANRKPRAVASNKPKDRQGCYCLNHPRHECSTGTLPTRGADGALGTEQREDTMMRGDNDWTWSVHDHDGRQLDRVNTKGSTRKESYKRAMEYARTVHGSRAAWAVNR